MLLSSRKYSQDFSLEDKSDVHPGELSCHVFLTEVTSTVDRASNGPGIFESSKLEQSLSRCYIISSTTLLFVVELVGFAFNHHSEREMSSRIVLGFSLL